MTKYGMTMTEALSHVREGFSPRLIKQAIGIASDKRYAGGNMSGAVDAIEKLQKGLSDHPQVMAVLKRQNEDVDMQEGRMKELHHHIKMGKSAKEIAKIMKLDFKTINALVDGLTYEEFEERKERYERVMSPYRSKGTESLDEAFSSWTVTILKTVNKIKKGDSKSVKAQNVAQALKKAAKAWGDDNLNSMPSTAFKVTKDTSESVEEGTESLDEKYDLYHKTFSGAMQHSYEYAKKKFKIEIDPTEIDDKVAMGPPKPKNGKTNSYRLKGKNGKGIQVQVYNTGTSFELNMYKESVDDVNEDKRADDKKRTAKELSKKDFVKAYTWGMDDKISKKDFVKKHGTEKDVASYWDSMNESVEIDEAISGDQYYYVDPKGVVAAVGNKDSMRKMNMKQAKDGNKGGSFSQNLKKYKVGDKIKEEVELDEFTISDLKGMGVKPTPDQMKELQKISSKSGGNITRTDLKKVGIKEEVEIDEGKMSQMHQMIKDKKTPAQIAKAMGLDLKTVKALMDGYNKMVPESFEIGTEKYLKHTVNTTPGQKAWTETVTKKAASMRETLAKMWNVDEGKNVFEKDTKKDLTKGVKGSSITMTGKKVAGVDTNPIIKEKKK